LIKLSAEEPSEEGALRRVYDHLIVHDTSSAVEEAQEAVSFFPQSKVLQEALIRALCAQGREREALEKWKLVSSSFEELRTERSLLETLAWGVLAQGDASSQLPIRLSALIGSALTRDARALPLLIRQMRSSNAYLRSLGVRLSTFLGDQPLQEEIARLLREESVWYVRLEVIEAIGKMKMGFLREELKEILADPKTLSEENAAVICALVNTYDSIDLSELKSLSKSNRCGLRELACELVIHLNDKEGLKELYPLLKDTSSSVRVAALSAIGLLRPGEGAIKAVPLLSDPAPEVAITAGWVLALYGDEKGGASLKKWVFHTDPEWRRMASAALSILGERGKELSFALLQESRDPFVRANLALGLLGMRAHIDFASSTLYEVFSTQKDLWMWDQATHPLFRSLAPSRLRHREGIPQYPKVINHLVRLDILTYLSQIRFPKAQEAVKAFLQESTFGVSGTAAATLLEEGDEEAAELVRSLLKDPSEEIRVQAALIMAFLGNDPSAASVLEEAYFHVDRERKIQILEALGYIGEPSSIPFLLDVLQEPFQLLRVVAASALIQCLYH